MKIRKSFVFTAFLALVLCSICLDLSAKPSNTEKKTMTKVVQTAGRDNLGSFAPEFAHFNDDVLFGENWNNQDITCKLLWYSADLSTLTGLILFIRYVLLDIVLRAIEFLIIYIVYEYKTLIQQSESPWNYSNHQTVYLLPTGYGFASLPSSRFALCAEHSVFLNS